MLTINLVVLTAYRIDNFDHPLVGVAVVAGLVAWTLVALWAYAGQSRRTPALLVADLAVTVAAMAVTPLVKGDFNATIPGFWIAGAMLAWAVYWHTVGGLIAGAAVSITDVAIRSSVDQGNYGNLLLLMIGGPIVGYLCHSLIAMAAERDAAERAAAAAAERSRLARAVHDGVLQVLALVQRQGIAAGGEFAELARVANEQERSLRALIRQQDTLSTGNLATRDNQMVDVVAQLETLAASHVIDVRLAVPAGSVWLASGPAGELVAVVKACLDNVAVHVAPDASAWVLVEDSERTVTISVRDEGPGIAPGRLETAQSEGRLGVASSIRGRMAELGGTATVDTGPWGTDWEMEVPKP